ncbi:MAG: DUF45 domain-containing protein [Chloroflexi bacterium]|nr:DUF45 domain-containing protein [Chloroflexota bacterium]
MRYSPERHLATRTCAPRVVSATTQSTDSAPPICLECVVVHELVHLLERKPNDRFAALTDWARRLTSLTAGSYAGWSVMSDLCPVIAEFDLD